MADEQAPGGCDAGAHAIVISGGNDRDRNRTPVESQGPRRLLPNRRRHVAFVFEHDGLRYHATASRLPDGRLGEIFLASAKSGSSAQGHADTSAILCSLLLQHGLAAADIAQAVRGSAIAVALELAMAP